MANREHWGTRVGLVLAMAGNAVGLGTAKFFTMVLRTPPRKEG